jgi:hypothetical protein
VIVDRITALLATDDTGIVMEAAVLRNGETTRIASEAARAARVAGGTGIDP